MQTRLGRVALESLSKKLDGKLEFSQVAVSPFNTLVLKDAVLTDSHPYSADEYGRGWAPVDTVAKIGELTATISFRSLFDKKGIRLRKVKVKDGYFHLVNEPTEQKSNIARIFGSEPKEKEDKSTATPEVFSIDDVEVENFRFRMNSFGPDKGIWQGYGMNWEDLDLTANLQGRKLRMTGGRVSGTVDHLDVMEKSGYQAYNLSGRTKVGMGKTTIEGLHLQDPWSDFRLPLYSMSYEDTAAFSDYLNSVRMQIRSGKGRLAARTISYFAPALKDVNLTLDVADLDADGFVNDMRIKSLRASEAESGVKADVSGTFTGLPDLSSSMADLSVNKLEFTTSGLEKLVRKTTGKYVDLHKYAPGTGFTFSGTAKGPMNRLDATGELSSHLGSMTAKLDIRNLADAKRDLEVTGKINTRNLDAGKIAGIDALGPADINTGFRAVLGKTPSIIVDSIGISRINLLGYDYSGLRAEGKFDGRSFDGKITSDDPNLDLRFDGRATLPAKGGKDKSAFYDFDAEIGYADLQALGLDRRGGSSKVGGSISARFAADSAGAMNGTLSLRDVILANDVSANIVGDIDIVSRSGAGGSSLRLDSDFAEGTLTGNRGLGDILKDIQTVTTRRELPAIYSNSDKDTGRDDSEYSLKLDLHDTRPVLSFAMPGLYIADSTSIRLDMAEGDIAAEINSPRVAWKTSYLKDIYFRADNDMSSINGLLTSKELNLGNVCVTDNSITAYVNDNTIFAGLNYAGIKGIDNFGEIYLASDLERDSSDTLQISLKPYPSYIRFNGEKWDIDESEVIWRAGEGHFRNFSIHNGEQGLQVNGGFAMNRQDTLTVKIDNVDLGVINYFTKRGYDFGGRTSGYAMVSSPIGGDMRALLTLDCDSLQVSGENAGMLKIAGLWDNAGDKANLFVRNIVDGRDAINLRGTYAPKSKYIDASVSLDEMNLSLVSPFLADMVSDVRGGASGQLALTGPVDSISISSHGTRFVNAGARIQYTGVRYVLDGPFHIDSNGLGFDSISIKDEEGGTGTLAGGISFRNFKDFKFNTSLRLRQLQLLGNTYGESFYGRLFASGDVLLSGPPEGLVLDARLSTAKESEVHVPLSGSASAGKGDLLTFTDHTRVVLDPYEALLNALYGDAGTPVVQKGKADFTVRCNVTALPNLRAYVELDDTGDNALSVNGTGNINLDLRTAKNQLDLSGDYSIEDGKYRFSIPGIVSKDFTINSGSNLKFGGDIMDTRLDIDATYSLRTSLGALIADTTSVSTRRLVNCGLSISDRLSSPGLGFSIDIPDLDPLTKAEVDAALNTEDKVQKQFLALLVTGSFIPSEQSGVVDNNNILYSNVGEIMSRQLSNIMEKLDIPIDLGLGYQQSSSGTDLFDVAVSTQLFNNRVEVNGSFGNRQYGTSTSGYGDIVGDLDIEYKVDRNGNLRLSAFSHSADEYSSYLDYSQRNGVGVTYQREFNTWRQFFRRLFSPRRNRPAQPAERPREEMTTIKISPADE